jgi:hypothetical protein
MPVYNGAAYLAETIESLQAQSMTDWELVAVDDCSQDGSWELLQRYSASDGRIRPHRHERNRGHRVASNTAFELTRGRYVARTDQDDLSLPRRLELQAAYLDAHPTVGLLSSAYYRRAPGGRDVLRTPPIADPLAVRWRLLFDNLFCHSTLMFRREHVAGPGTYRNAPAAYDYEICARLARRTAVAVLPEPLVVYRMHTTGLSSTAAGRMERSAFAISALQLRRLLQPPHLGRAELCSMRRLGLGRGATAADLVHLPLLVRLLERFGLEAEATESELRRLWRGRILGGLVRALPWSALAPLLRHDAAGVMRHLALRALRRRGSSPRRGTATPDQAASR